MQYSFNFHLSLGTENAYKRCATQRDGTATCVLPRRPALAEPISPGTSRTLQDLLDLIGKSELAQPHLIAMLKSTVAHVSLYLGRPPGRVEIRELEDALPGFKAYLRSRDYERNSTRSYVNYVRILLRKAEEVGWHAVDPDVQAAWSPILAALPKTRGCGSIVRFAVQKGIRPTEFTDRVLDEWEAWMLTQGRTCSYVLKVKGAFRNLIFQHSFRTGLANPSVPAGRTYAVPFRQLPEPLRPQIEQLLEWKVAEYSPGRPEKCRQRPITALQLRGLVCRIFAFLHKVRGKPIHSLQDLLTKDSLSDFVAWNINERKNRSAYLSVWLGMLLSTARRYPALKGHNLEWISDFLSQIPTKESEIFKHEAKERKWVDYDELAKIPKKIRQEREAAKRSNPLKLALMARNELLVAWLVALPWRQRNLRECKLAGKTEGGNLFKEELAHAGTIAKPLWVEEALKINPREKFWQFCFRPQETKSGQAVHALLPKQLVPLLEEYLRFHRVTLVRNSDPGTLFVNSSGQPLSAHGIYVLIGNITRRHTGRRVNPHLFRDIFAVKWLAGHPEDYLTVSKILWHRDIQTTLRIYGRNFDESHGVRRIEEWLEERGAH